mmetsp:Transcript_9110/g.38593  ORF Transcript_9110/g.38593 Transcript_9110/m.38593 type:complete len:272 (+) Transcript_9110:106-921(+)
MLICVFGLPKPKSSSSAPSTFRPKDGSSCSPSSTDGGSPASNAETPPDSPRFALRKFRNKPSSWSGSEPRVPAPSPGKSFRATSGGTPSARMRAAFLRYTASSFRDASASRVDIPAASGPSSYASPPSGLSGPPNRSARPTPPSPTSLLRRAPDLGPTSGAGRSAPGPEKTLAPLPLRNGARSMVCPGKINALSPTMEPTSSSTSMPPRRMSSLADGLCWPGSPTPISLPSWPARSFADDPSATNGAPASSAGPRSSSLWCGPAASRMNTP